MKPFYLPFCMSILIIFSGCATYRSEIGGAYSGKPTPKELAASVNVLLVFTHNQQRIGLDTVPKIIYSPAGFQDILRDALPEITNIRNYATFTELSNDVDNPKRRAELDSLASSNDYIIRMRFRRQTSFPHDFLWGLVSSVTCTGIPAKYVVNYSVTADVQDKEGRLVRRYQRDAEVRRWVHFFLVFVYPFHPEERKVEEVYVEFIRNIFREIEHDRILVRM